MACVLSSMPIVWACFVVAVFSLIPRSCITSFVVADVNCEPLSEIIVVGR